MAADKYQDMAKLVNYRDLDLNFFRHPVTNDVSSVSDTEAIKRSVRQLLSFKRYEKPFHPEINAGVYDSFFDPMNSLQVEGLKDMIKALIHKHEKRVILNQVGINQNLDSNEIDVTLYFTVINLQTPLNFTVSLVRNR